MNGSRKSAVAGLVLSTAAVLGVLYWQMPNLQTGGEIGAIKKAYLGAEQTIQLLGCYQTDGKPTFTEQERTESIARFEKQADNYFSNDSTVKWSYIAEHERLLTDVEPTYLMDSGISDCDFKRIAISADGNTAVLNTRDTIWMRDISPVTVTSGGYQARCIYNVWEQTTTMVKEDGVWKVLKEEDTYWLDDGTDVKLPHTPKKQAEIERAQQMTLTNYTTFDDAYAALSSIDPVEANPYLFG